MAASKPKDSVVVEMESLEVPGESKDGSKKRKEKMASDKKSSAAPFDGVQVTSNVPSMSRTTNYGHNNQINSNSGGRNKQFMKTRDVNPPRFLPLSSVHQPFASSSSVQRQYHYHQGINYVNPGLNYLKHVKPSVTKQRSIQSNTNTTTNNGHKSMSIGSQSSREGLLLLSSGDEELLDDDISSSPCPPPPFPFSNTSTDGTDVRQMEQGLLQLLDDFHLGKLQAFGKDITFEKMEQVREKQERLARLHFELMASTSSNGGVGAADGNGNTSSSSLDTEEGRIKNKDSMNKLMGNLQELSSAIEQLQSKKGTSK